MHHACFEGRRGNGTYPPPSWTICTELNMACANEASESMHPSASITYVHSSTSYAWPEAPQATAEDVRTVYVHSSQPMHGPRPHKLMQKDVCTVVLGQTAHGSAAPGMESQRLTQALQFHHTGWVGRAKKLHEIMNDPTHLEPIAARNTNNNHESGNANVKTV